jgi:P27 family predicted phage terminase small subunit
MGRGRRPTPDALKELAGNPGHRPLNDQAPQPEREAPEMPKGMGLAARREWHFIVPILLRLGVLSNIDGKALAAYCDSYAMWERARKQIDKYGLVVEEPQTDKDGNLIYIGHKIATKEDGEQVFEKREVLYKLKANPAVGVYNTFGKLMKSYLIEFGLTPASRSKLKIDKKPSKDPLEAELAWMPPGTTADVHRRPASFVEN